MNKVGLFIKNNYKRALILFFSNFMVAAGASFCFLNYKHTGFDGILTGGVSGFTLIINQIFKTNLEFVATILTWVLYIIGAIFLKKRFAIQTLISAILFPAFLFLFKLPIFKSVQEAFNTLDPILDSALGGICMGTGCGLVYRIDGSTGGFDVPPLIINKFFKIKLSILFFIQDGILVLLALIANFNLNQVVVGLVSVLMCSTFVEVTQVAGQKCYVAEIISDRYEEINKIILEKLERGTTLFEATGGYTGQNKKVIRVMIPKKQYHELMNIVNKIDSSAFMTIQVTNAVFGDGFRDFKDR